MLSLDNKQAINVVRHDKNMFPACNHASKALILTLIREDLLEPLLVRHGLRDFRAIERKLVNKINTIILARIGYIDGFDRVMFDRLLIRSTNEHALFAANVNGLQLRYECKTSRSQNGFPIGRLHAPLRLTVDRVKPVNLVIIVVYDYKRVFGIV